MHKQAKPKTSASCQFDLFEHVAGAYAQTSSGRLTNAELYRMTAGRACVPREDLDRLAPIGKAEAMRSIAKRSIRWHQQTLKTLGILERVDSERGVWELTAGGRQKLKSIAAGVGVVAFSTELGIAIWGDCNFVFGRWDEPICLMLSSPPYPLRRPRAYGNPGAAEYVDFMLRALEPIVRNLVPGGSIVLNLSNDIFEPGSPARSTYLERLTIALEDRLGLRLMERFPWVSNKPPGPMQWASKHRVQFNVAYEPVLWFSNDPEKVIGRADNRRVLEPHTEKHNRFVAGGGAKRALVNGDGAFRLRQGAYSSPTAGRIPKNVLQISNMCPSQREYKRRAKALGLQPHGATMPLSLARKLTRFLTDVDDLVVDIFGGSMTTPLAAELEGRRWVATDVIYDYVRGGAERFGSAEGFELRLPLVKGKGDATGA